MSTAAGLIDAPSTETPQPRWQTLVARLGMLGVVLAFVGEALTILRANHAWLVHRAPDDAFYYLEIGQRLARNEGTTFDGANVTSGFHPLWQGMVTALARLIPGDDPLVKAVLLLALCLFAVAIVLVVSVLRRAVGDATAWVAALVAVHAVTTMRYVVDGMEGAAVVLALAIVLVALQQFLADPGPRRAILLGATCAVAVLARLDLVVVIWLVPLFAVLRCRRWSFAAWWCGGLAVIGLPAATWWYVHFGHVFSTSAAVKAGWLEQRIEADHGSWLSGSFVSSWLANVRGYFGELLGDVSAPGLSPSSLEDLLGLVLPLLAFGGLAVVLWERTAAKRAGHHRAALSDAAYALAVVGGVVAIKAMIDQITEPDWSLAWYSAPVRVTIGITVGVLAMRGVLWLVANARTLGVAAAALMAIVLLPAQLTTWMRSDSDRNVDWYFYDQLDLAADWLIEQQPTGQYGAKDAGVVGYRVDPTSVVNIDGLVNDYDFADVVTGGATILDRIRYEGIEVYIGRLSPRTRTEELACATTMWTSPGLVPQTGGDSPVYVLDTRNCLP